MPGARHLEHDRRQPVADEVVDVAGDPTPLGEKRLLGQLPPGALELGGQVHLPSQCATDDPGEGDAQDPDVDGDLGRVLNHRAQHGSRSRDQAESDGCRERGGPATDDEREQAGLEHEGLEVPRALRNDDRHDDGDADGRKRHIRHEGPQAEGGDRCGHEEKVDRGGRRRDCGDHGDHERERGNEAAKIVGFEPPSV